MRNVYTVDIAGCKRNLPICKVNKKLGIAAFIMFGDVEATKKCVTIVFRKIIEIWHINCSKS